MPPDSLGERLERPGAGRGLPQPWNTWSKQHQAINEVMSNCIMFTTGFQLLCDQLKDNWMYIYGHSLASRRYFAFLSHSLSFNLLCNVREVIRGSSRGGGRGYRPSVNRNDSDLSAAGDLCCKSCPIYFSLSPHFLTSL